MSLIKEDAVHPAISLGIALWFGLCVGLTIWLLHPAPDGSDLCSVALTFILFYIGATIAKHTVLLALAIIERLAK